MTPTEVLLEIRRMPVSDRRRVRDEIDDDLLAIEGSGHGSIDLALIESMKAKGLITYVPNRLKGKIPRNDFKRVDVIGKPASRTIIEDRG